MEFYYNLELNEQNRQIFAKRARVCARYIILLVQFVRITLVIFGLFLMVLINILRPNKLRLISTIVWLPSPLLAVRYVSSILLGGFYSIHNSFLYLLLRFRQISENLEINGQGKIISSKNLNNVIIDSIGLKLQLFFRQREENFQEDYRV